MVRTVTVKNYTTQEARVFENIDVNTWGKLKKILEENDIEVEGMNAREGLSKVQLLNDDSILPHGIPYKGKVTNDLFILLTLGKKNLNLGGEPSREEVVNEMKKLHLEDVIKELTGKHWTNVSTVALYRIVSDKGQKPAKTEETKPAQEDAACPVEVLYKSINVLANTMKHLVNVLFGTDVLGEEDREDIIDLLKKVNVGKKKPTKGLSEEEMDEIASELL